MSLILLFLICLHAHGAKTVFEPDRLY